MQKIPLLQVIRMRNYQNISTFTSLYYSKAALANLPQKSKY